MNQLDQQAGSRLRMARSRLGMTTYELSSRIKVPQSTYSKYENGRMSIKLETLTLLYLRFGVSPLYVCCGKGPMVIGKEKETIVTDLNQLKAEQLSLNAKVDYLASRK